MKPTLYDLTGDWLRLQEMLAESDVDGELEGGYIEDTLEAIEGAIDKKAASIVYVMKNLSAPITAIDDEIRRLKAKKEVIQNGVNRLKDYIQTTMEAMELDKIETDLIKIRLQNSPPSCVLADADAVVPDEYKITEIVVSLDKKKAVKDMKQGIKIPGLRLFQGRHIVIR